jgi:hypothetical protein
MNLDDVRRIARTYVPVNARDPDLIEGIWPLHGPAHEIAHLLLAAPHRRRLKNFGLPTRDETSAALIEEHAACIVHCWIVVATDVWKAHLRQRGGPAVSPDAILGSVMIHGVKRVMRRTDTASARKLIAKRGITRDAVQTVEGLTALCRRARVEAKLSAEPGERSPPRQRRPPTASIA